MGLVCGGAPLLYAYSLTLPSPVRETLTVTPTLTVTSTFQTTSTYVTTSQSCSYLILCHAETFTTSTVINSTTTLAETGPPTVALAPPALAANDWITLLIEAKVVSVPLGYCSMKLQKGRLRRFTGYGHLAIYAGLVGFALSLLFYLTLGLYALVVAFWLGLYEAIHRKRQLKALRL